jgi:hypothetical protein
VTGLLPGMQATLSVDSSGHLEQRGGPPCPCTLTGDGTPQSLTFQFNTQTNPTFSAGFTIGPSDNDPYLDNNTATVDYPPPPAQRAFRSGIQR